MKMHNSKCFERLFVLLELSGHVVTLSEAGEPRMTDAGGWFDRHTSSQARHVRMEKAGLPFARFKFEASSF